MISRFEFVAVLGPESELRLRTSIDLDDVAYVRESPENPYRSIIFLKTGLFFIADESYDDLTARIDDYNDPDAL